MLNNPHHVRHWPRQSNVQLFIHDGKGEQINVFHKLTTLDLFVVAGVSVLEIKEFEDSKSVEPKAVTTIINPNKWTMIAHPDPEKISSLP